MNTRQNLRRRGNGVLLTWLATMAMLAGCASSDSNKGGNGGTPIDPSAEVRGIGHPWPNEPGVDWPNGLTGPFELASLTNVQIPAFDGILLDGWVLRPKVPEGVKVPVVLWSAPYFGLNNLAGNDPSGWDNSENSEAVPVNLLVTEGYAVAIVNLRGSGNSQGCNQFLGSIDRKDTAAMVEWLGTQEWSNGRVGMMGLSYHGTTPWMAAVEAPPHLKTIVTAGQITSLYTFLHTPQGAPPTQEHVFATRLNAVNMAPPARGTPTELADWPGTLPTKLCPELVEIFAENPKSHYTDLRDAAFWDDRDLLPRYKDVQASVFLTMGLRDYRGSLHQFQEDYAWANLPADLPKRMLVGQWEHMFPNFSERYTATGRDWNAELLAWLDFWLKGVGDVAPLLGVVEYQDSEDRWYQTQAWPPTEAVPRALYLAEQSLGPNAEPGARSFVPRPQIAYWDAFCQPQAPGMPQSLLYQTAPLAGEATLAGNPFVLLELESDRPGGQIAAFLIAIEEGIDVEGGGLDCGTIGEASGGIRFLGLGAADLRHHAGNYVGSDFPVGVPTQVRMEINNFAEVLHAGERLGLLLAHGDNSHDDPSEHWPTFTIHAGRSHVVVPLAAGTLPAADPWPTYPTRPFDPTGGDPTGPRQGP